jgi:transcriptional regulator with XRE-family HTH domain
VDNEGAEEQPTYTASQLAEELGCSVRSIYRWEKGEVIPKAERIDRGMVQARVYTKAQAEEIRKKVKERITFTAMVRERYPKRKKKSGYATRVSPKMPPTAEDLAMDPDWAPIFLKAIRVAQAQGCAEISLKTANGEVYRFSR